MNSFSQRQLHYSTQLCQIFYQIDERYQYIREHLSFSSCEADEKLIQYRKHLQRIQSALKALNNEESYIITQTFRTDGKINNRWWKGIYPRSTFYRLRMNAMKKFLKAYGVHA